MKVVLELQDQPSNIRKVTVRHDIVIGRGAECNLRLSAPQVSRRHCFLRVSNDSATITDLDSSNGTYINGKRISSGKRYQLKDETQLAIGPVSFVARVVSEVPAGELLEMRVNDERIESESAVIPDRPFDDSTAEPNEDATNADLLPESDAESMNFALESAGPAAGEDDPTADYVATDGLGDSDYFSNVSVDESGPSPIISEDQAHDGSPSAGEEKSAEAVVVDEIMESDSIEVLDVISEVEIIEDDEVVLSDDDDIMVVEEEAVVVVADDDDTIASDDEEILVVDEEVLVVDDEAEIADADKPKPKSSNNLEDELKDFLSGLD